MKKKILWFDDYVCYPTISGYRVVVYDSLVEFSKFYDIIYISRAKSQKEKVETENELTKFGIKCEIVVTKINVTKKINHIFRFLFSKYPLSFEIRYYKEILNILQKYYDNVDLFFFEGFYLSKYAIKLLKKNKKNKILIRFHNNDLQRRKDIFAKNPTFVNFIYLLKLKKIQESILLNKNLKFAVLSEDDFLKENLLYLPPLIRFDDVSNKPEVNWERREVVVFVASFKNEANDDALLYLKNDIWTLIYEKFNYYKCFVFGKNSENFSHLTDPNINFFIKGSFDKPEKVYGNAFCAIVPLRIGSGVKLKVLEAIKNGVPVITTSVGLQGLPFEDGKHILVANTPNEFLLKFTSLINNIDNIQMVVQSARKILSKNYGIKTYVDKIENIIIN